MVMSVAGPARTVSAKATEACILVALDLGVVFRRAGCLHCSECRWACPWDVDLVLLVQGSRGVHPSRVGLGLLPCSERVMLRRRVPELGVLHVYSAWPVVSTAGVSLVRPVVYCAC
jgi:hypothetical protein